MGVRVGEPADTGVLVGGTEVDVGRTGFLVGPPEPLVGRKGVQVGDGDAPTRGVGLWEVVFAADVGGSGATLVADDEACFPGTQIPWLTRITSALEMQWLMTGDDVMGMSPCNQW
jgi:hypothetical protein